MCGEVRCIIALYLCPLDADPLNEVVLLVQSPSGSVELHGVLELGGQTVLLYPEDSDWLINLFWNEPWVRITHGIYDTTISSQGFRSAYNMFYKRRLLIQER
jgi:hypothetical protein